MQWMVHQLRSCCCISAEGEGGELAADGQRWAPRGVRGGASRPRLRLRKRCEALDARRVLWAASEAATRRRCGQ